MVLFISQVCVTEILNPHHLVTVFAQNSSNSQHIWLTTECSTEDNNTDKPQESLASIFKYNEIKT